MKKKSLMIANFTRLPGHRADLIQILKNADALANYYDIHLVLVENGTFSLKRMLSEYLLENQIRIDLIRVRGWKLFLPAPLRFWFQLFEFKNKLFQMLVDLRPQYFLTKDVRIASTALKLSIATVCEIHCVDRWVTTMLKSCRSKKIRFVAINREIIKKLNSFLRIEYLPDGFDSKLLKSNLKSFELKRYGIPSGKRYCVYTGQFYKWKGVDLIVQAAEKLQNTSLHFICVGGSSADIERYQKRNNLTLIPHQSYREMAGFLKLADILILPNTAHLPISKFYTSPLKLFEYLSTGKTIFCSDLPSLRDVVGTKQVSFFKSEDVSSLVSLFKKYLCDPDFYIQRSKNNSWFVKKYEWQERAKTLHLIFNGIS